MDSIIARVGRVFEAAFTFPASQVTTETTPDDFAQVTELL